MSAREFKRDTSCYCKLAECVCSRYREILDDEGLGELERYDDADNVLLGNRGSGEVKTEQQLANREGTVALHAQRRALLDAHEFETPRDRKIYALYADGKSLAMIAKRYHTTKTAIFRTVHRIEREYALAKTLPPTPRQLSELVNACEPTTLILFFALLQKAVDDPDSIRQLLADAQRVPELRGLIDPEPANDNHVEVEADE